MSKKEFLRPDEDAMQRVLTRNKGKIVETILRLSWNMGFSVNEMQNLTWSDLSFQDETITLPDRTVPMDPGTKQCLQERCERFGTRFSEQIIITDLRRVPCNRVHIYRIVREALDQEGMTEINLVDLQRDFIIRQLQQHNKYYVSRISGWALTSLDQSFSSYYTDVSRKKEDPESQDDVEFLLWKLIQAEGASSEGIALRLILNHQLTLQEAIELTWEDVDFENKAISLPNRQVPLAKQMKGLLEQVKRKRTPGDDSHVLITPNARKPYDIARISRSLRMALIRGGLEHMTMQDLIFKEKRKDKDRMILNHVAKEGSITKSVAMKLIQEEKLATWTRLHRLETEGKLIRVGLKYYDPTKVVPPEEQYEVIAAHLKDVGSAYRRELADLLRVDGNQCHWILHNFIKEGKLELNGQRYSLPQKK